MDILKPLTKTLNIPFKIKKNKANSMNIEYVNNVKTWIEKNKWKGLGVPLAKIKKIDDSDLKNPKYYPYDAVHW